jgi:hypothetical protein
MQKNKIVSWLLCAAALAVLVVGSFQVLFRVFAWAGPAYASGETTIMGATGYAMARPMVFSLLAAIPVSYIPKFRSIPGRYLLAWGVLLFLFCSFSAIRIYSLASSS